MSKDIEVAISEQKISEDRKWDSYRNTLQTPTWTQIKPLLNITDYRLRDEHFAYRKAH